MSMIIDPYRFGVPSAPTGWVTATDGSPTGDSGSWGNYTVRVYVMRSLLPAGATKVRITFRTFSGGGTDISKAFVGQSRKLIYDVAPSQLLFSGSPGFLLAASSEITSDELNLTYDGLHDLCISFHVSASAGANNRMSTRSGSPIMGSDFDAGDLADDTGGTWSPSAVNFYFVKKIEVFTGGTWNNIFTSHSSFATNWNNYTVRSLVTSSQFTRLRNTVRFGVTQPISKMYVGPSAGGASPFNFASTPTQVLFGGLAASPTEANRPHFSDDFDMTGYSGDLLMSIHTATTNIGIRSSPPTGQSSRYKSGDSAANVTWQSGSSTWAQFLATSFVDEKY